MPAASFPSIKQTKDFQMNKPTNSIGMSKPNLNPPNIEQVSEYRRTTNQGSQPQPPRAAQYGKGASGIEQIREATEARRKQSASWSTRDVGPQTYANPQSKRK
jgi:hypothetical protein